MSNDNDKDQEYQKNMGKRLRKIRKENALSQDDVADALGIYFRPNIPGSWNGMYDKYLMKTTPEALLSYWSRVFPRDFLDREDTIGITPGYKKPAENL